MDLYSKVKIPIRVLDAIIWGGIIVVVVMIVVSSNLM